MHGDFWRHGPVFEASEVFLRSICSLRICNVLFSYRISIRRTDEPGRLESSNHWLATSSISINTTEFRQLSFDFEYLTPRPSNRGVSSMEREQARN